MSRHTLRPHPNAMPFPYTTLFRSDRKRSYRKWQGRMPWPQRSTSRMKRRIEAHARIIDENIDAAEPLERTHERFGRFDILDRKRSRLKCSHVEILYVGFCVKTVKF